MFKKRLAVGLASHEVFEELEGGGAIALAQHALAQLLARRWVEDALLQESVKAIGGEDFRPFVAVVAACISTAYAVSEAVHGGAQSCAEGKKYALEDARRCLIEALAFEEIVILAMQFKIHDGQRKLSHVFHGGHEMLALLELLFDFIGNLCARLMMAREDVEALRKPSPVFGNLAGELHKVPCDIGARLAAQLGFIEHEMQDMTHFMEENPNFVVAKKRLFVTNRAGEVADDCPEVGEVGLATQTGVTCADGHHPSTSALIVALEEIEIEGA